MRILPEVSRISASIRVIDLGRMRYAQAFDVQQQVHVDVVTGRCAETLLLVEHEPVITITRRPGAEEHLLAGAEMLAKQGVEVCETNRGGDITYHGPGQIVVYPIVRLTYRGLNLRSYVHLLQQAIIQTLERFGIEARCDPDAVGVWVGPNNAGSKIAAIGVRAQRWVTMHGLALNVTTNLDHFKLIVPCGLAGRHVTSMKEMLGERCPEFDEVKHVLADVLLAMLSAPKMQNDE